MNEKGKREIGRLGKGHLGGSAMDVSSEPSVNQVYSHILVAAWERDMEGTGRSRQPVLETTMWIGLDFETGMARKRIGFLMNDIEQTNPKNC